MTPTLLTIDRTLVPDDHGVDRDIHRVRGFAVELECRGNLGQQHAHGQRDGRCRDDEAEHHRNSGHPRDAFAGDPLGPVVDRPGERKTHGQLGKAQGEQHLADDCDNPGPDRGRAANAIAEAEEQEHAGQDRNECKAGCEGGKAAQGAGQFLLIAKRGEKPVVFGQLLG
jgi:hypothetical protein